MELLTWLGSGFAFAIGVFVGMLLVGLVIRPSKRQQRATEETLNALLERNQIGRTQGEYLDRMADAMSGIEEHIANWRARKAD